MGKGMTNEERIELLKEVARVAPKEWEADHCTISGEPCVQFEALNYEVLRFSDNDIENAPAIIVMLDAMEEAGAAGELAPRPCGVVGGEYYYSIWPYPGSKVRKPYYDQEFDGKTRAEAVARAFVEVFKSESPNTPEEDN